MMLNRVNSKLISQMNKRVIVFLFFSAYFFSTCKVYGQGSRNRQLSIITSLSKGEKEQPLPEDSVLKSYLRIELISRSQFLSKQKTAVNFVTTDSTGIKKKNGKLRLPIKTGSKVFTDKSPFDESKQEYTYLGQIGFLNAYIIGGLYWEELDYKFISKVNGAEMQRFGGFPYVSPDKKHILTIYADPYDTDADLELFNMVKGRPKLVIRVSFKNWMPAVDKVNMFWSSDGYFYVPVLAPEKYWKQDGNLNDKYEYIRIGVR